MAKKPTHTEEITRSAGPTEGQPREGQQRVSGAAAQTPVAPTPTPLALTNIPILSAIPIVTPTANDYIPVARVGDKTAYRAPLPIGESIVRPLMGGVADPGNSVRFSRGDHVHPVDTSLATKTYVDTQDAAVTQQIPPPSSSAPAMDGTAAAGAASAWARADHVHPVDTSRYGADNPSGFVNAAAARAAAPVQSVAGRAGAITLEHTDITDWADALAPYPLTVNLPPASTELPAVNGAPSAGIELFWSRADHIHPVDPTRYAASNPAGYQTAAQVTAVLPVASTTAPLPSANAAAVGTGTTWARSDHVHPMRMGVTDGSEAVPGQVGEHISASVQTASAITAATGVTMDVTSITLTPGDWDVQGQVATLIASGGHVQNMQAWSSTVSKTRPTQLVGGLHEIGGVSTGGVEQMVLPTGRMRLNLTVTTVVYLSTLISFTGTGKAMGYISARRVR